MYHKQYFRNTRSEMLEFIPTNAQKILEFGCGEANFCAQLMGGNREIWGVEINPRAAEEASRKISRVLVGDIKQVLEQLPKYNFDCIVFNDVLEHTQYPLEILKEVIPLLSPSGIVVSSIPNFRFVGNLKEILIDKNFAYKDSGILDITHMRFFTKSSIAKMYDDAGFNIVQNRGINDTPSWKVRLFILLTFNFFSDIKSFQIATVAQPKIR